MRSERSRHTISSIYDAALVPDLWPLALDLAVDSVGGVGAAYYVWNKRTGQVEWLSMSGPLVDTTADYASYYRAGGCWGFASACPKPCSVATSGIMTIFSRTVSMTV